MRAPASERILVEPVKTAPTSGIEERLTHQHRVRRGERADAIAAAATNVAGWRTAFRGVLPDSFLAALSVEGRAESLAKRFSSPAYGMTVAENLSEAFLGFADWGPGRGELRGCCELYSIYVDPQYHRQGVGRLLFRAAASAVVAEGHDRLRLSVLAVNPHIDFYRRLRGERVGSETWSLAGAEWEVLHFEWAGARLTGLADS